MNTVITIRPVGGAERTLAAGRTMGLDMRHFPLSEVIGHSWHGPEPTAIDGVLAGSANAFRHGGEELRRYTDKPVFAVGQATAAAARKAGFAVAMTGKGGLQELVQQMAPLAPLRLLRLAGVRHVPLEAPVGIIISTCTCYALACKPLPAEMADLLRGKALVLLHSADAAEHFAAEADRLGLPRESIRLAALGPRIAAAAGPGWSEVRWPRQPDDGELLALARKMCQ